MKARRRQRIRHGGQHQRVDLEDLEIPIEVHEDRLLAVDEAMARLEKEDPRKAEVQGVSLNAGLNVLLFKVGNSRFGWEGSVRLLDATGQPIQGIRVTLDPDRKD